MRNAKKIFFAKISRLNEGHVVIFDDKLISGSKNSMK
jgi:hypothetical protein